MKKTVLLVLLGLQVLLLVSALPSREASLMGVDHEQLRAFEPLVRRNCTIINCEMARLTRSVYLCSNVLFRLLCFSLNLQEEDLDLEGPDCLAVPEK